MPEIITRYPAAVESVLKAANMKCGTGVKPKVLTSCPDEKLCQLPSGKGEICVYSIQDIDNMSQISSFQFLQSSNFIVPAISLGVMILVVGIMAGMAINKN